MTADGKAHSEVSPLPVDLRTRFERFPATVKGAFVLQGADGNPHKVRFDWARVARVPSGGTKPVPIGDIQVDAAPGRNLFVPFEAGVSDLEPGWYVIKTSVQVDAGRSFVYSSRGFSIPWPRSEVRRGTVRVGRIVKPGGVEVAVERLELAADSASVVWRPLADIGPADEPARPGGGVIALLTVEGKALDRLPEDVAPRAPKGMSAVERRTVSYPVPKAAASVALVMRIPTGEESEPISVTLG